MSTHNSITMFYRELTNSINLSPLSTSYMYLPHPNLQGNIWKVGHMCHAFYFGIVWHRLQAGGGRGKHGGGKDGIDITVFRGNYRGFTGCPCSVKNL